MLYIISTPIGNLKDITLRAVDTLESLDILLCEDTRKTGVLLKELGIKNDIKLESFYDEVEQQKIPKVIEWLHEGLEVGLVTDAGTPLISDPGWLLVKKCQDNNIPYTAIPGVSAVINAAVLSGLPIQRFCFLGFLPKKNSDKTKLINKFFEIEAVKIAYDTADRVEETINILKDICGEKVEYRVIREMTKMYEEVLKSIEVPIKGEVVVLWN